MGSGERILLTGSTGFIGKRLEKVMREQGRDVVALSRSGEGGSIALPIESHTDWTSVLENVNCVIHTAARVHVMNDREHDPLTAYRALNVAGTENLARQAANSGVKRFVFLSSAKVNGEDSNELGRPLSEDDPPHPDDPYSVSKYEAEVKLRTIARDSGMEFVIIRPPLVYGPGVKANFYLMMKFIDIGLPLPLGAISNKRSLVGLSNFASFILECVDNKLAANEIFFVSDGADISTSELLKKLSFAFHRSPKLLPFPVRLIKYMGLAIGKKNFVNRLIGSFQLDISKANALLGWYPHFSMEDELAATVDQFLSETKNSRFAVLKNGFPGTPGR